MTSKSTVDALARLGRGRYKLSKGELKQFHLELRNLSYDEIEAIVFPPTTKSVRGPDPDWLKSLRKVYRSVSWSAADAEKELRQLTAKLSGHSLDKGSFKKTATAAAKAIGEHKIVSQFQAHVASFSGTS